MISGIRRRFLSLAVQIVAVPAFAWGGWDHTVVAYIAQEHLTPRAESNLRYYLDQPLTEYAEWMDFVPLQGTPKYKPLIKDTHMFTLNPDGTVPRESIVDNGECSASHMMNMMLDVVRDHRNQPDSLVVLYLRCLVHMFGDFHCPVHVLAHSAPGGFMPEGSWRNHHMFKKCFYEGKKVTMHNMWDTVLQREKPEWTYEDWRLFLDTFDAGQRSEMTAGSFDDWLMESGSYAEKIYDLWQPGLHYDNTWYDGKITGLAHSQIIKAAYRLASYLNEVFDYE